VALPSLDSVPLAYLAEGEKNKPLEMPTVVQTWLTNLIDTMNEALLEIDKRLTAGGL
jgi:hypothetical protein